MAITRSMTKNQTNTSELSQIQTRSQTRSQSQTKISPNVINIVNRIFSLPTNDMKVVFNRLEKMIEERQKNKNS